MKLNKWSKETVSNMNRKDKIYIKMIIEIKGNLYNDEHNFKKSQKSKIHWWKKI